MGASAKASEDRATPTRWDRAFTRASAAWAGLSVTMLIVSGFAIAAERPDDTSMGPGALLLSLLVLAGVASLYLAARSRMRWFDPAIELDEALAEGARLRQLSFVLSLLSVGALIVPMAGALQDAGAQGLYDLAHYSLPTPYPLGITLLAMASSSLLLWEVALALEGHGIMRAPGSRILAAIGIAFLLFAGVQGSSHAVRGQSFFGSAEATPPVSPGDLRP